MIIKIEVLRGCHFLVMSSFFLYITINNRIFDRLSGDYIYLQATFCTIDLCFSLIFDIIGI